MNLANQCFFQHENRLKDTCHTFQYPQAVSYAEFNQVIESLPFWTLKPAETARCLLRWRHEHPGGSRWRTLRHQLLSRQVSVALDPRTWPIQKGSSGCWVWSQAKWFTDGLLSFERKPCAIWIYDLDVSLIPGSELVATFSFISSMRPSYQFDFMV